MCLFVWTRTTQTYETLLRNVQLSLKSVDCVGWTNGVKKQLKVSLTNL